MQSDNDDPQPPCSVENDVEEIRAAKNREDEAAFKTVDLEEVRRQEAAKELNDRARDDTRSTHGNVYPPRGLKSRRQRRAENSDLKRRIRKTFKKIRKGKV